MPRIITNRWLPLPGFSAINLCGLIFVRPGTRISREVLNHELIHTRQQWEMLVVPFYVWYVTEWLLRLAWCRNWHRAYSQISFEREAYRHQRDLRYLQHRRLFAWMRYLFE